MTDLRQDLGRTGEALAAEQYPHWEFDTHVGYSTPEHRAAIERHGVSPLHRLSFQSVAYSQLAL